MYDVNLGAAVVTGAGVGVDGAFDCECEGGREKAEPAGADAGGICEGSDVGAAEALGFVLEPKRPRMSSTVARCVCGPEDVPGADVAVEEPKISAKRSWLFCAVFGWPLTGVETTSSPRRSA